MVCGRGFDSRRLHQIPGRPAAMPAFFYAAAVVEPASSFPGLAARVLRLTARRPLRRCATIVERVQRHATPRRLHQIPERPAAMPAFFYAAAVVEPASSFPGLAARVLRLTARRPLRRCATI